MARLSRAEQQVRTRAAVLAAARAEFSEHGYAEARVDRIAESAGLTRGAIYANFPGKRALYLAVLLDLEGAEESAPMESGRDLADAVEAFARIWLERLPLTSDAPADGRLRLRSLTGVFETGGAERAAMAGVARLEGLLLALALEERALEGRVPEGRVPEGRAPGRRLVRLAEVVRSLLDGVCHQAEVAPGVGDPFDVVRAGRHLASLDLGEAWEPPHRAFVAPAERDGRAWDPPEPFTDLVGGDQVDLWRWDGLIVVLGTGRLGAAEEAVRSGEPVTLVVVSERPAELGALVRLRVADMARCLRRIAPTNAAEPGGETQTGGGTAEGLSTEAGHGTEAGGGIEAGGSATGRSAGPGGSADRDATVRAGAAKGGPAALRVVVDDDGAVAGALRVGVAEQAEVAVRVRGRHMVARAEGRGAALAVADYRADGRR
ncbi:helix-turn-helix domain-containing protein [Actinoplanes sp. NPDC089786]|uniref:TetR/AcrR family transcriptional regulator n=1 Tax=Actinoplanes sp. NPDC089786 TaxID=3155185 RepID=UPI003426A337